MQDMFSKKTSVGSGSGDELIEYNSITKGAYSGLLGLYNSEEIHIGNFEQMRKSR